MQAFSWFLKENFMLHSFEKLKHFIGKDCLKNGKKTLKNLG